MDTDVKTGQELDLLLQEIQCYNNRVIDSDDVEEISYLQSRIKELSERLCDIVSSY